MTTGRGSKNLIYLWHHSWMRSTAKLFGIFIDTVMTENCLNTKNLLCYFRLAYLELAYNYKLSFEIKLINIDQNFRYLSQDFYWNIQLSLKRCQKNFGHAEMALMQTFKNPLTFSIIKYGKFLRISLPLTRYSTQKLWCSTPGFIKCSLKKRSWKNSIIHEVFWLSKTIKFCKLILKIIFKHKSTYKSLKHKL